MKFSKFFVMAAAASMAVGAFADAANVLVSFSTTADFYADGTTAVEDGEWYALCWSPRETFGGLDLDCNPVKSDEAVLILAPLAKDGHCPDVLFQIDSAIADAYQLDTGYYFVYVLDTRDANGKPAAADQEAESGRRVPAANSEGSMMNGAVAKTSGFTAGVNKGETVPATESAVAGDDWAAVQPKITYFGVDAGKVNITVTGVMPGAEYKVKMGATPASLTTYGGVNSGTGTLQFKDLDPKGAKFFKVVRE
jgi:hypothetical protein